MRSIVIVARYRFGSGGLNPGGNGFTMKLNQIAFTVYDAEILESISQGLGKHSQAAIFKIFLLKIYEHYRILVIDSGQSLTSQYLHQNPTNGRKRIVTIDEKCLKRNPIARNQCVPQV